MQIIFPAYLFSLDGEYDDTADLLFSTSTSLFNSTYNSSLFFKASFVEVDSSQETALRQVLLQLTSDQYSLFKIRSHPTSFLSSNRSSSEFRILAIFKPNCNTESLFPNNVFNNNKLKGCIFLERRNLMPQLDDTKKAYYLINQNEIIMYNGNWELTRGDLLAIENSIENLDDSGNRELENPLRVQHNGNNIQIDQNPPEDRPRNLSSPQHNDNNIQIDQNPPEDRPRNLSSPPTSRILRPSRGVPYRIGQSTRQNRRARRTRGSRSSRGRASHQLEEGTPDQRFNSNINHDDVEVSPQPSSSLPVLSDESISNRSHSRETGTISERQTDTRQTEQTEGTQGPPQQTGLICYLYGADRNEELTATMRLQGTEDAILGEVCEKRVQDGVTCLFYGDPLNNRAVQKVGVTRLQSSGELFSGSVYAFKLYAEDSS